LLNSSGKKELVTQKNYSQSELSQLLGYKNGQFISNVERALCNIPLKMLNRVSEILNISPVELKEAMLLDHQQTLDNFLEMGTRPTFQVIDGGQSTDRPVAQGPTPTEDSESEENVQTPHNPYVAKAM
jgi:transcriptional regulator with XRE-family HTH domain